LAVLIAPWRVRLTRANDQRWWFTIWLVRWLAFRLMFLAGVVKLASHDPTWQDWTALEFHYQTQPLPAWTSWYIHQMPVGFHRLSVGFMFFAELVAPFFVFGPRPIRLAGFATLVDLQFIIAATGNYGFFNLLAGVICLCILDDRDHTWLIRRAKLKRQHVEGQAAILETRSEPTKPPSRPRRTLIGLTGGILFAVPAAGRTADDRSAITVRREFTTLSNRAATGC